MNSIPEGSQISRLETLRQVEKSTGKKPKELQNQPVLKDEHEYVFDAYSSLMDYTYTEIMNYMILTGIQLSDWEIQAIIKLAKHRK